MERIIVQKEELKHRLTEMNDVIRETITKGWPNIGHAAKGAAHAVLALEYDNEQERVIKRSISTMGFNKRIETLSDLRIVDTKIAHLELISDFEGLLFPEYEEARQAVIQTLERFAQHSTMSEALATFRLLLRLQIDRRRGKIRGFEISEQYKSASYR